MVNLTTENGVQKYGVIHLVADTPNDLSNLPTTAAIGSTCFVISTSKTYMLNSSKEWIEVQLSSGGDGSSEEVIYNGGYDG